jgi:hypothetical protein
LQRQHPGEGISGWIDYTHTRALSAVPADFEQPLSVGAKISQQLLPTTFVPSDVANLVLDYHRGRLEINPEINWASGYRYGVGRTILCYGDEGGLVTGCEQAPAGVLSRQPNPAFYVNGDVNGIPIDNAEGNDPNSLVSRPTTLVNMNIYYDLSARAQAGVQIQNLFANYAPIAFANNPYFTYPGGPGNGISPYGLDYGQGPYTPFAYQGSQEFLFSLTFTL